MLWFTTALGSIATLHVAIHREAGAIHDIAVDGAVGQCRVIAPTRIQCPADGPVRFRWGPGGEWVLTGDTEVGPGQVGTAFVMAPPGTHRETLAVLQEPTYDNVREAYFRTGANELPVPSLPLVERLIELSAHEDWRIRRLVTRSLVPYVRHTSADPFPAGSPTLIPAGLLVRLATDPDVRVRRRAAHLIRELNHSDPRSEERRIAVESMRNDRNRRVRKLAIVLERDLATEGEDEALEAWNGALSRVPKPKAPGRAASNSLAVLHGRVDPERVDVEQALARVLQHHPERGWRVWAAWRREIPFDPVHAEFLLRETVGLSQALLRHWASHEPEAFADLLERWEPEEPHSERWRVIGIWVDPKAEHPRLRQVLGLPDRLSDASEGVEGE